MRYKDRRKKVGVDINRNAANHCHPIFMEFAGTSYIKVLSLILQIDLKRIFIMFILLRFILFNNKFLVI